MRGGQRLCGKPQGRGPGPARAAGAAVVRRPAQRRRRWPGRRQRRPLARLASRAWLTHRMVFHVEEDLKAGRPVAHEVDQLGDLAHAMGLRYGGRRLALDVPEEDLACGRSLVEGWSGPRAAVHLQRGWLTMPGVQVAPSIETTADTAKAAPDAAPAGPQPLADLPEEPQPWQWGILACALLVCVMALLLPGLLGRAKSPVGLLSDSGQTVIGKPALEILPRWEAHAALPSPRSRLAVAQVGHVIYALGGEGGDGQTLDRVEVYPRGEGEWNSAPPLPEPFTNADLARARGWNSHLAGKATYALRAMGLLAQAGKQGRANLFTIEVTDGNCH